MQVLVPKQPELLGKMITVKILATSKYSMTGELIDSDLSTKCIEPSLKRNTSVITNNTYFNFLPYTLFVIIVAVLARIMWLAN